MLFINCIFLNESSRNLSVAISHAQFAQEETKNTVFASIANATWDNAAITSKGLTPLNNESVAIRVTGTEPKDVNATVYWKDRGVRDRSVTLETMITEP